MTVIRPNSISGINSITGHGGDIKIFRADGTAGDVTVNNITSGVITATTFSGNITGNLSNGTINATSGTITGNLGVGGVLTYEDVTNIDSIGIITARAGINVSGGVITGDGSGLTGVGLGTDGSANTSGIITATSFVPTAGQLSHRNIIVNGAMTVAQRASSSTTNGYGSVDRFQCSFSATDESPTHTQHTLTSSDTGPYAEGFRKSFHVQNGNQTGGAGASDFIRLWHKIEAQDLANSGWNYTSSSSYITLSFWVKSSVAQTYYVQMRTGDGTSKMYYFAMNLSANTWTKVTHSIPGHADLTFDSDNGEGIYFAWYTFRGTNNTGTVTANQWNNYSGSTLTPDQTTTWYTTNDATFEITGVQLEVGPVATPFEHRTYQEEILRCMRYYQQLTGNDRGYNGATGSSGSFKNSVIGIYNAATDMRGIYYHMVPMRDEPSLTVLGALTDFDLEPFDRAPAAISMNRAGVFQSTLLIQDSGSATAGQACELTIDQAAGGLAFSAEL